MHFNDRLKELNLKATEEEKKMKMQCEIDSLKVNMSNLEVNNAILRNDLNVSFGMISSLQTEIRQLRNKSYCY